MVNSERNAVDFFKLELPTCGPYLQTAGSLQALDRRAEPQRALMLIVLDERSASSLVRHRLA